MWSVWFAPLFSLKDHLVWLGGQSGRLPVLLSPTLPILLLYSSAKGSLFIADEKNIRASAFKGPLPSR